MGKGFFNTAIKSLKTTGAISQSSPYLVNSMLRHIDFTKGLNIVELGGGHGNITKAILEKMNKESILHSFEINEDFYKEVNKIEDARLEVVHDSAEHLHDHFKGKSIDVVVSSLPLTIFSKQLKHDIFSSIRKVISSKGVFIQFQYTLNDYKLIKKEFDQVELNMTVLNIPPAFIYVGKNER